MTRYIMGRLLATVGVLFGVSILLFVLFALTPGDPARLELGPERSSNASLLAQTRHGLGLDRPLPTRYLIWLRHVLHGDFGRSYSSHLPALDLVREGFTNTLILAGCAMVLSTLVGLTIGVVAGARPNSPLDRLVMTLTIIAASVPIFWLGLMLLIIFSLNLGWLPAGGIHAARGGSGPVDLARHLALPMVTTSVIPIAILARMVRSAMMEVMQLDFIQTARAKGLAERAVTVRHGLRSALPSFISIVALQLASFLSGSLVTEVIFSWPGMGYQIYAAIAGRDMPVVMAITLLVTLIFTLLNLLADVLQGVLDPRIRLA